MKLRRKLIVLSFECGGDWYSMYKMLKKDPLLKQINENNYGIYQRILEGINILTILDDQYPEYLKEEQTPPFVIYYQGNLDLLYKKRVGVLGAKYLTYEANRSCEKIFNSMKEDAFTIVYAQEIGCERFFDELAFLGGKIKILSSWKDNVHKDKEVQLAKIDHLGLFITEFPPSVEPSRQTMRWSLRLVSYLSEGIFCVELKTQTQSFRQVSEDLEMGKYVYVLPGKYDCLSAQGSFRLVNKGAKCFFQKDEFLKTIYSN